MFHLPPATLGLYPVFISALLLFLALVCELSFVSSVGRTSKSTLRRHHESRARALALATAMLYRICYVRHGILPSVAVIALTTVAPNTAAMTALGYILFSLHIQARAVLAPGSWTRTPKHTPLAVISFHLNPSPYTLY